MSVDSDSRRVIVVLRPTVSGLDESAARRMFDAVRAGTDVDVRVAYLDVASPSLHEELDRAHTDDVDKVVLIPVAVPRDRYLFTWTSRAVANWRETRIDAELEVSLHEPESFEGAVAGQVIDELGAAGKPITASPASYRSPAWSVIEPHDKHLLVCKGPRCMAYGAGPLHRAMSAAAKGTSTKVTGTGCLSPCNLGPLVIANPDGSWFGYLGAEDADALVAGHDDQLVERVSGPEVHRRRRMPGNSRMTVNVVVLVEESFQEHSCIIQ